MRFLVWLSVLFWNYSHIQTVFIFTNYNGTLIPALASYISENCIKMKAVHNEHTFSDLFGHCSEVYNYTHLFITHVSSSCLGRCCEWMISRWAFFLSCYVFECMFTVEINCAAPKKLEQRTKPREHSSHSARLGDHRARVECTQFACVLFLKMFNYSIIPNGLLTAKIKMWCGFDFHRNAIN